MAHINPLNNNGMNDMTHEKRYDDSVIKAFYIGSIVLWGTVAMRLYLGVFYSSQLTYPQLNF